VKAPLRITLEKKLLRQVGRLALKEGMTISELSESELPAYLESEKQRLASLPTRARKLRKSAG
jgi:hypothetical protein